MGAQWYVFNCPYHGEEAGLFCWRAFDPANKVLWKKYEVFTKEIPLTENDLDKMLEDIRLGETKF